MGIFSNRKTIQELQIDGKNANNDLPEGNTGNDYLPDEPDDDEEDQNGNVSNDDGGDSNNPQSSSDEESNNELPVGGESDNNDEDFKLPDDESDNTDNSDGQTQDSASDNNDDFTMDDNNDSSDNNSEEGNDSGNDDFTMDDNNDSSGTDDTQSGSDDVSSDNSDMDNSSELQSIENDLFKDLTEEQIHIKEIELKENYIKLYDSITDFINRTNKISKTNENLEVIEFIANKLIELKDLVHFYLTKTFKTKTYIENTMMYQQYLAILNSINQLLLEIVPKNGKSK